MRILILCLAVSLANYNCSQLSDQKKKNFSDTIASLEAAIKLELTFAKNKKSDTFFAPILSKGFIFSSDSVWFHYLKQVRIDSVVILTEDEICELQTNLNRLSADIYWIRWIEQTDSGLSIQIEPVGVLNNYDKNNNQIGFYDGAGRKLDHPPPCEFFPAMVIEFFIQTEGDSLIASVRSIARY